MARAGSLVLVQVCPQKPSVQGAVGASWWARWARTETAPALLACSGVTSFVGRFQNAGLLRVRALYCVPLCHPQRTSRSGGVVCACPLRAPFKGRSMSSFSSAFPLRSTKSGGKQILHSRLTEFMEKALFSLNFSGLIIDF